MGAPGCRAPTRGDSPERRRPAPHQAGAGQARTAVRTDWVETRVSVFVNAAEVGGFLRAYPGFATACSVRIARRLSPTAPVTPRPFGPGRSSRIFLRAARTRDDGHKPLSWRRKLSSAPVWPRQPCRRGPGCWLVLCDEGVNRSGKSSHRPRLSVVRGNLNRRGAKVEGSPRRRPLADRVTSTGCVQRRQPS